MDYELIPRTSLGPVRLGMSRVEVRRTVGETPKEVPRRSGIPMDYFVGAHLQVEYGLDDRSEFIQACPGLGVLVSGVQLMGRPFSQVRDYLRSLDSSLAVDGPDLTSNVLQVAIYAGSASKDPHVPVEAVAVFVAGYYGR